MSTYLNPNPRPHGQHLQPAPTKRITTPTSQRLNTIVEGPAAATVPPRSSRRPPGPSRLHNAQRSHLGAPPQESDEKPPPSYSQLSGQGGSLDDEGAHTAQRGKFGAIKQRIVGRGGWKRVLVIILALIFVIIVLGVGLGLGLKKDKREANGQGATGASAGQKQRPFPIGVWNFDVVLASVDTDCTGTPETWNCLPYEDGQPYQFNWNITTLDPEAKKPESLQISPIPDFHSLQFPPTPLRLMDNGTRDERYLFSLLFPKRVQLRSGLNGDNANTICYFNQSSLSGTLYRQSASGDSDAVPAGNSTIGVDWPGTLFLSYSSPSGAGTPDCYHSSGGPATSPRITEGIYPPATAGDCSCVYETKNSTRLI